MAEESSSIVFTETDVSSERRCKFLSERRAARNREWGTDETPERSPLWGRHLVRASEELNRPYMFADMAIACDMMQQKNISLFDILWQEGYKSSDYVAIEDGVKIGYTDSSDMDTLALPTPEDVELPFFVAHQNGVFLMADTIHRQYALTEDIHMVRALREHGYIYEPTMDVPLADPHEVFVNPVKDYKWRRHHKKNTEAERQLHSKVLTATICSPEERSESEVEEIFFRDAREERRAKHKGKFRFPTMSYETKKMLKDNFKFLGALTVSLNLMHSVAADALDRFVYKDYPQQPKTEQKGTVEKAKVVRSQKDGGR